MKVSQVLEAIDHWRSGNVVEFTETVWCSNETPKQKCDSCWDKPSTSTDTCVNLCLIRTATMMDASGQNNNEQAAGTSGICDKLTEKFKWLKEFFSCRKTNQVGQGTTSPSQQASTASTPQPGAPQNSVRDRPSTPGSPLRNRPNPGRAPVINVIPPEQPPETEKEDEPNQPGPSEDSTQANEDNSKPSAPSTIEPSGIKASGPERMDNPITPREAQAAYDPNYLEKKVITQQPTDERVSNEPVSGSSGSSQTESASGETQQIVMNPASSSVRYQPTPKQSTSSANITRETTVDITTAETSRRESVDVAVSDDESQMETEEATDGNSLTQEEKDLGITLDNSAPTDQERKQRQQMKKQKAVCYSSNETTPRSDGLSTHNEVLSPLAQPSTSNTDVGKESDDDKAKKDSQEDDKDNEGSSGLLRGANAMCLPEEHGEHFRSSTTHHSELFGSIIVDDEAEQESENWLEYFEEEYAENSLDWN
ncbi:hypothetical protein CAEBREN_10713 [Caenorhabditis brenneri]|uniref:Uncharacterized protein n=1 Tax=Caenorhabditis brenneri TaxID=135651 RepID=G0NME1_CAEBE|nr:hypothetical protein CAEBREN_10713 [Caenorhabditis brenneri]